MATGVAFRLHRSGFRRLVLLEQAAPLAVRRSVCLSEAVYHGSVTIEGVTAVRVDAPEACVAVWAAGNIPVLVDEKAASLPIFRPDVVIEVTLAKCNVGVSMDDARLVIGVGPGFTVGTDVHAIVESNRGPDMGRVLYSGSAEPNTGIPGTVKGLTVERVLRAPRSGIFTTHLDIGHKVEQNGHVGEVDSEPVFASIGGVVRGLLPTSTRVTCGVKIGDIEPREGISCHKISEKALALGGGVLEAILHHYNTTEAE